MEDGQGSPGRGDAVVARDEFVEELRKLGFSRTSASRRGGDVWAVPFNRHLTFSVHDDHADEVVLTWAFGLGEYVMERGWQLSITDMSTAELYPQGDVRVRRDAGAVRGEMTRVLARLRLDLGDPDL